MNIVSSDKMNRRSVYDVGNVNKYGSKYSSLVAANPYANMDYRKSSWQEFLTNLGFRTNYDAYQESLALQAKEYDAAIAEKAYNEEYDSTLSQVQRQREAGINPDIAGDVSAGSSSALRDDGNPPTPPVADDFAPLQAFGSIVFDGIKLASGLAESGLGMMSQFTDLRGKKIDNDNKLLSSAFDAMLAVTSPEDMDNFMDSDMSVQAINYFPSLSEVYGRRRAKKYVSAVNRLARGLKGHDLETAMRNNFAGNWISYYDKTAGGEAGGFSMFSDTMKIIREGLSKNLWENLNASTKLQSSEIADKQQYEDIRLAEDIPGTVAHNEGMVSGYGVENSYMDSMLKKQQYSMQQATVKMISQLNAAADKGNWFAGLASMAISWLMSRFSGSVGFKF